MVVVPFAGKILKVIANKISSNVPTIKDGIETKAVVIIIMILSAILFLLRAATEPKMIPVTRATIAATIPSFAETLRPSEIISITFRPLCLSDGPKSKSVRISLR